MHVHNHLARGPRSTPRARACAAPASAAPLRRLHRGARRVNNTIVAVPSVPKRPTLTVTQFCMIQLSRTKVAIAYNVVEGLTYCYFSFYCFDTKLPAKSSLSEVKNDDALSNFFRGRGLTCSWARLVTDSMCLYVVSLWYHTGYSR